MAEGVDQRPNALRGPLAMGVAVFALALACVVLTREAGRVAAVWPVNAVVLAALLRSDVRSWPRFLLAGLAGNVLANTLVGDSVLWTIALSGCNVLEIALAAGLMRRLSGPAPDLTQRRTLAQFLLIGGVAAPAVSALLAALLLQMRWGGDFQTAALSWYAPDALGLITVTPALLAVNPASMASLRQRLTRGGGAWSILVFALSLAAAFSQQVLPLLFLIPPALIYVAFQLGLAGAALALMIGATAAVAATLTGHGSAAFIQGPMSVKLTVLQLLLATLTLSVLPVAVALARQARLREELTAALVDAKAAQATMTEAQRMSRLAEQIAGIGYWRLDIATNQNVWSDQMYAINGVTRATFENRLGDTLNLFEVEAQVRIQTACRSGAPFELTAHLLRGDNGERRTVVLRGETERDAAGKATAIFGVMRDITDEERAALALKKSEAQFRQLADGGADVVVRISRDGLIEFISAGVARYGYAPRDLVGKPTLSLVHPEEHAKVAALQGALFGHRPGQADPDRTYRILQANGDYAWVEGNPGLVRDDDGEVVAITTHLRDVSSQRAAATALAESEARFRLLADSATDLLLQVDPDDTITFVSPSARRFGYEPEDLIGTKGASYIHPDDLAVVLDRVARLSRGETIDPAEDRSYRSRKADGEYAWVEANSSAVRDPSGAVQSVICQLRDVSQRKAVVEALSESEARYRLLANNMSDVIACYGRDGRLTYLSPAVETVLGYTADELIGSSIVSLIHPEDAAAADAQFKAHIAEGPGARPFRCEYRVTRKNGDLAWLEAHPRATYDPQTGAFVEWQDVVRDITERKAVDAALAESELRYRLIAENATDIITRYSVDGRFNYISPSVETVIGYNIEELIGRKWLDYVHPDDVAPLVDAYRAIVRGLRPEGEPIRYRCRHKDGRLIWLECNPTPVRDGAGRVTEFVDVTRDVNIQALLEAELRTARDEAQSAAETKADFMANMSHEIRTPLTAILGFTRLLESDTTLSPQGRGHVGRVASAGDALLSIVNDVLDFSKLEAGLVGIKPEPCAPGEVLRDTLLMFQPQADAKGLALRFEGAEALPPALAFDWRRVRQVLTNLIGNAVKFTDTGHVTLAVAFDPKAGQLSLAVQDSGAGMDEDQQQKLFRRYSQVDASAAKQAGGTGLGLVISRGLIEAMGGEIGVRSQAGAGSTFHVRIPAAVVAATQVPAADAADTGVAGARILIADDNPTNRELARVLLQPLHLEIAEAGDGLAALQRAMTAPYDLILLDVRMPGLSGPEVAARLRAGPGPNSDIPILAFTADADLAELGEGSDFDGIVSKPISPADLTETIVRHLSWLRLAEPAEDAARG